MKFLKLNYWFFVFILLIFLIDRYAKIKIISLLENQNNLYINDYLNLSLVFNTGIGFGLFSLDAGIYYNLLTIFILSVIFMLFVFMIKSDTREKMFYSLVIGGAIGNLYDRIFYQAVPDFIDFHIENFHWFSFNIADIFISLGIIFMIINEIFFKNKKNEN
tara:strand:+ start:461 stop:943 length:483 start_codon:yes stop_codon:yes gene_type:complete